MSETRFSAFQNSIDEKYLTEAAKGSVRKKTPWLGAVAACLCVGIIGFVALKSGVFNAKSAAPAAGMESAAAYEDACEEEGIANAESALFFAEEAPAAPVPAPEAEPALEYDEECAEAPAETSDYAMEEKGEELYGPSITDDDYNLPEGACLMYSEEKQFEGCRLYEGCFSLEDRVYVIRITATLGVTLTDISGATGEFAEYAEGKVSYCPSELHWNEDGNGYICWYDVVPGISYALYVDKNASEKSLTEMAETVFRPMQGDS